MSGQAKITSVEALAAFRADMIVYLGHMRPVIEEVGDEVARMKYWLQIEQRGFWDPFEAFGERCEEPGALSVSIESKRGSGFLI